MSLLDETIDALAPADAGWRDRAHARLEQLTMPHWALGRVMDLAEDLAAMTRSLDPPVARKAVVVMAADHGVAAEGVSLYPPDVTGQMVRNFVAGGAAINALAGLAGARVIVVDMGVAADLTDLAADGRIVSRRLGAGTANIARGPAMSREAAAACVEAGIQTAAELADDIDVFGTGDMGIGNTTASAAIVAAFARCAAEEVTGHGTGIDREQRLHKVATIERALAVNHPNPADPLDVLAKVGGFEIGAIAGLVLGAAARRKPVVVDGFISTAGALLAAQLARASADYMILAHRSVEQGHPRMAELLGKAPLLDLGMRLGEGTGAALAMNLVEAGARILTQVATFGEAGVSGKDEG